MRTLSSNACRIVPGLAASVLLLVSGAALAQSSVNLTAAPTTTLLPDGQTVPMWGYTCGIAATTGAVAPTCVAANPKAGTTWSPVVITVPYTGTTTSLTINLTNSLSFTTPTGTNTLPTSLIIVGQLGGGLGTSATTAKSPSHAAQTVTWPSVNPSLGAVTNTPVAQVPRVQSFGTEVVAGATTALTWSNLRPGTYLIESGTHPSIQATMGLYGILVVTTPAASPNAAYTYNACVSGSTAPCDSYDANLPVILSEIDPVQNATVAAAVATAGFSEATVWSGQPNQCGNPTSANYLTCYPPVVNYSPRYYLLNGVSFDRTNIAAATASVLAPAPAGAPVTPVTGNVLINFVNAGSRMHVPSVVGLPFALVAEDGNALPGLQRVQNEVFLSAGKTYDVLVKPAQTPATTGGTSTYTAATYPIFDRQLSLSTNNQRDGGMTAYITVAGGAAGGVGTTSALPASGVGNKTY